LPNRSRARILLTNGSIYWSIEQIIWQTLVFVNGLEYIKPENFRDFQHKCR
jgi:hypothetical protein